MGLREMLERALRHWLGGLAVRGFSSGSKGLWDPRGPAAIGNPSLEAGPWRGSFLGGADSRFPELCFRAAMLAMSPEFGSGCKARQCLAVLLDGVQELEALSYQFPRH